MFQDDFLDVLLSVEQSHWRANLAVQDKVFAVDCDIVVVFSCCIDVQATDLIDRECIGGLALQPVMAAFSTGVGLHL